MDAECGADRMGSKRVIRGGSWNDNARNVRAAYRNANRPDNRNDNLGFRLARAREWVGRLAFDQICAVSGPIGVGETQMGAGVGVAVTEAATKPRRWPAYAGTSKWA